MDKNVFKILFFLLRSTSFGVLLDWNHQTCLSEYRHLLGVWYYLLLWISLRNILDHQHICPTLPSLLLLRKLIVFLLFAYYKSIKNKISSSLPLSISSLRSVSEVRRTLYLISTSCSKQKADKFGRSALPPTALRVGGCSIDKVKNSSHHLKSPSDSVSHSRTQSDLRTLSLRDHRLLLPSFVSDHQERSLNAWFSLLVAILPLEPESQGEDQIFFLVKSYQSEGELPIRGRAIRLVKLSYCLLNL